jgi:hypothetical protein
VSDLLSLIQMLVIVEAGLMAGYAFDALCPPRRRRRRRRQAT